MSELKGCPFCGKQQHPAYVSVSLGLTFWRIGYYVECWWCGARGPTKFRLRDAVAAWNTRAPISDDLWTKVLELCELTLINSGPAGMVTAAMVQRAEQIREMLGEA